MGDKKLKVLFLDIGGVLLTNGWGHQSRQKAAAHFGFDHDAMDHRHDLVFNVYEEGKLTLDQYLDAILFYEHRNFSREEFKTFLLNQSQPLPNLLPWLIEWKAAHPHLKVFSINNEPKELHEFRVNTYGLRNLFDGFICSCYIGMRKPDLQMYQLALNVAAVPPEECLYVDDRKVLVDFGKQYGLNAWQHKTFDETVAHIKNSNWRLAIAE